MLKSKSRGPPFWELKEQVEEILYSDVFNCVSEKVWEHKNLADQNHLLSKRVLNSSEIKS